MKIAFLNLCHCDPDLVARAAMRLTHTLTGDKNFDMYIHVDAKSDFDLFYDKLHEIPNVFLIKNRRKIYWGGFNAVEAVIDMMKEALYSGKNYDYFVTLQNLDYPIHSNSYIEKFFEKRNGTEFIRACKIAQTRNWHFSRKYKIYNKRDDDFYLTSHSRLRKYLHYLKLRLYSLSTIFFNGIIHENNQEFPIYYGAAQWAVTRKCAEFIVNFYDTHPEFNDIMCRIQFPDEEYFHTVVHNSEFKYKLSKYDEEEKLWLVNWRNLHYFEYPKQITVFTEKDYLNLISQKDTLFVRKVMTGTSDTLLDMIDAGLQKEELDITGILNL